MAQERVSITVHLVVGQDDDLIEMIKDVKGSDRAQLVKSRLRGLKHMPSRGLPDYTPVLDDIVGRVYWLQERFDGLPDVIDGMLSKLVAQPMASIPPKTPPPKERVSQAALDRRKERTKNNGW